MSSKTIDISEIKIKLNERLKPSGWSNKLKSFILSSDFDRILEFLVKEVNDSKRFTPKLTQVFRAFEECPYDSVKVVCIGQDPYPTPSVADGIAFSCSNTGKEQPSLTYMFDEIERSVYPGESYKRDVDLSRWSHQGVLLINSAFTTTINRSGSHFDIWKPFITFLLDTIGNDRPDIVYMFLGKQSVRYHELIPEDSINFYAPHPASAAHNNLKNWESNELFIKVNEALIGLNKLPITW